MMTINPEDPVIIPSISGDNIKAVFTTKHGDPKKKAYWKSLFVKLKKTRAYPKEITIWISA